MALSDDIQAERGMFLDTEELAVIREFTVSDGAGGSTTFTASCQWDDDILKTHASVQESGIYLGDVMVHVPVEYFTARPKPGQILFSPASVPWRVLEVIENFGMYQISLQSNQSQ